MVANGCLKSGLESGDDTLDLAPDTGRAEHFRKSVKGRLNSDRLLNDLGVNAVCFRILVNRRFSDCVAFCGHGSDARDQDHTGHVMPVALQAARDAA